MTELLIGTDIGTLSTKSIIATTDGKVLAHSSIDYEIITPKPLWADFPMEDPLRAVYNTIKNVIKQAKADPKDIIGACISGLYIGSGIPVNKEMEIIRPAIPWLDKRATAECKWIAETIGEDHIAEITGNCIDTYWGYTKMEWLRMNEPKTWERIYQLVTANAYAIWKLTSELSLDYSSVGNYGGIFDIHKYDFAESLMEELKIPRSFFPEKICKSCDIVGEVTAEGEKLCGLRKGTPIAAGGIDAPVEALSVGTLGIGEHTATLGTSMCWNIVQDRASAKIDPALINYPYVANDEQSIYSFGGATTAAGIITWFRDNLAKDEVNIADQNPELSAFQLLDEQAKKIPPGSNGLIILPYFMGERTPIWDSYARGTIIGLTLYHTRAHLYRAFLEGVAFSLKDNVEAALTIGVQLDDEMTLIGGGAKSSLWRQIFADITGYKIKYLSQSYGAPLGDVLLAGVGNKLFDYTEIKKWSEIASISEPNPRNKQIYHDLFQIYRKLYLANKNLYPDLPK
ncbi:MAG: FGGY-family carbohydrate kinase [Candidatus Helarchaeota archaeon]